VEFGLKSVQANGVAGDTATSGECERLFSGVTSAQRPIDAVNATFHL